MVRFVAGLVLLLAVVPAALDAWRSLAAGTAFDPITVRQRRQRFAGQKLTFLTTNDMHSAIEGFAGPDRTASHLGHYARLGALINEERRLRLARAELVITTDSGDFMSGSMYDSLGPSDPVVAGTNSSVPELEFFSHFGYDAVTVGNHDFDRGELGLQIQLDKLASRVQRPPAMLATNYVPPVADSSGDPARAAAIHLASSLQPHTV